VKLINNKITAAVGKGIAISSSSDMVLSGNATEDSKYSGIDVIGSTRLDINGGYVTRTGLRMSGKSYKGIKFDSTTDSTIEGVETFDNSDTGIYLINGTTRVRVKKVVTHHNARVFDRAAAGIELRSSGNIVESSIAYANEDSGINMRWGGSNALIVNNTAYRNGDHGIDALESPNPRIFYNSVYKNVAAGINVEGNSTGAAIMNNISHDNGINSPRTEGDIRVTISSAPGAVSNYNVLFSSTGGRIYHWNGTYFRSLTTLHAAYPGVDANGIQADPEWEDPALNNFRLTSGSPAIDSAKSDVLLTPLGSHDALGNSRCDDSLTPNTGGGPNPYYDRGAFEYVANCP
jgi:parallel beta-helix repeat protein